MRVSVKKSDPPETTEILATAIVKIGDNMKALLDSGLNKRAVIVLLHAETKLPQKTIQAVLDALPQLRSWYCNK